MLVFFFCSIEREVRLLSWQRVWTLNFVFQPRKVVNWSEQFLSPSDVVTLVYFLKTPTNKKIETKPFGFTYLNPNNTFSLLQSQTNMNNLCLYAPHSHCVSMMKLPPPPPPPPSAPKVSITLSHCNIRLNNLFGCSENFKYSWIKELYIYLSYRFGARLVRLRENSKYVLFQPLGILTPPITFQRLRFFSPKAHGSRWSFFFFALFENIICIYLSKKSILMSLAKYIINVRNME